MLRFLSSVTAHCTMSQASARTWPSAGEGCAPNAARGTAVGTPAPLPNWQGDKPCACAGRGPENITEMLPQRQVFKILHQPEASIYTQKSSHRNTNDLCHMGMRAWRHLKGLPATLSTSEQRGPSAVVLGRSTSARHRANRTCGAQPGSWLRGHTEQQCSPSVHMPGPPAAQETSTPRAPRAGCTQHQWRQEAAESQVVGGARPRGPVCSPRSAWGGRAQNVSYPHFTPRLP